MECQVNTCCGGPAYDTPEGMEKRRQGGRILRVLSLLLTGLGGLSLVVGIVSLGLCLTNPHFPEVNGCAVVSGILLLIGGIYGVKATADPSLAEVDRRIRAYVMVHYVMSIMCLTFTGLQIIYSGLAVGECLSDDAEKADKCKPFNTANAVLAILLILIGVVSNITCIAGAVFFCVYARVLGYNNQYDTVNDLRREVRSLRQQIQTQNEQKGQYTQQYSSFDYKSPPV